MSSRDIIAICQRCIIPHPNDCSEFVRAVAIACGVLLVGDANTIVETLKYGRQLPDGPSARQAAVRGALVIGGVQAKGHGHVVVVVDGPLDRGRYPYAFWGQYRGLTVEGATYNVGFTRGHGTLNYAFGSSSRDAVVYAAVTPLESMMERSAPNEGYLLRTFV